MSASRAGRHTRHGRDANHAPVMARFRALCPVVEDHSQSSHGYDAIIVTARGLVYVVEIKDGTKPPSERKLTTNELLAQARWGRQYKVVLSEDEAIELART